MYSTIIVFLFGGVIALIAVVISAAALIKAWRDAHQVQSARDWLTISGSITSSSVEEMPEGGGDGPRLFRIHLRYTYQVADARYEGSRIYAGDDPFGSQNEMRKLAVRYPVGSPVEVYYNPSNPAESVLLVRSQSSTKAIILGVFFFLVAMCIICLTLSYPSFIK